jgi:hypothetical protein
MDTVTYPEPRTADFVSRNLIALRINAAVSGGLTVSFKVQYTPTVIILDGEGHEHHRFVGFLPPAEFIPSVMLGMGRAFTGINQAGKAASVIDRLISEHPASQAAEAARELKSRQARHGS